MEKRRSPFKDQKDNDLYEGDSIRHRNGDTGVVFYSSNRVYAKDENRRWRAIYTYKDGKTAMVSLYLGSVNSVVEKVVQNVV